MGTQVDKLIPAEALVFIRRTERQLYIQLPGWIARAQAGPVSSDLLTRAHFHMVNADAQIDGYIADVTSIPLLRQYARDQWDDQTQDIVAEYQAMRSNLAACISWLDANGELNADPAVDVDATGFVPLLQALKASSE
jgi:hypothetical protein